jgi:hypothetical protein
MEACSELIELSVTTCNAQKVIPTIISEMDDLRHTLQFIPNTYFTVLSIRRANLCQLLALRGCYTRLSLLIRLMQFSRQCLDNDLPNESIRQLEAVNNVSGTYHSLLVGRQGLEPRSKGFRLV